MIVGACRVVLHLPDAHSLKDKRQVVKSILARVHNQFNVSAAEVEDQDLWQRAVIGVAVATNDTQHANRVLSNVVNFIEGANPAAEMTDYQIDIAPILQGSRIQAPTSPRFGEGSEVCQRRLRKPSRSNDFSRSSPAARND